MATKPTPKYTVGQEVWLIEQRQTRRLVPVVKVGRSLVTIEQYGRPRQFRIETGEENGNVAGYAAYIRTQEEQADVDRRAAAEKALEAAGLSIHYAAKYSLSVETIEALALVAADHPSDVLPADVADAIATLKAFGPPTP